MVTPGLTIGPPFKNVYEEAPEGFNVNELPGQIEPLLSVKVGSAKTVSDKTTGATLTQPLVPVPVTP